MKQDKKLITGIIMVGLLLLTIGYSIVSTRLNVEGISSILSTWKVKITDIKPVLTEQNAYEITPANYNDTSAIFNVGLTAPGDKIKYKVTVSNIGTINAKLELIETTIDNNDDIIIEVKDLEENELLPAGSSKDFYVEISYNINSTTQSTTPKANLSLKLNYIQSLDTENNIELSKYSNYDEGTSIYSWHSEYLSDNNFNHIYTVLQQLNVKSFYQEISTEEFNYPQLKSFVEKLYARQINVYQIFGYAEAATTADISTFEKKLAEVVAYNNNANQNQKIKGMVMDVEPYTTDAWTDETKSAMFTQYLDNMTKCYELAHNAGLEFILVIPAWYDSLGYDSEFERLFTIADGYSVMNYSKKYVVENIEDEIEMAIKHDKYIESIAEAQAPTEEYGVTEDLTFYNDGLDAIHASFNSMKDTYNYEKLRFSYHHFRALNHLTTNTYSIRIKDYDNDGNYIPNLELSFVDSEGNEIKASRYQYSDEKEAFYVMGLQYGVDYTINTNGYKPDIETINYSATDFNDGVTSLNITFDKPVSLASVVSVGDYVNYPYEYTNATDSWGATTTRTGWRVLAVKNGSVMLISAGTPETIAGTGTPTNTITNIQNAMTKYLLTDYAISVQPMNKTLLDNLNPETDESGFIKISPFNNDTNYWLAETYSDTKLWMFEQTGDVYGTTDKDTRIFGIRPVITLKSGTYTYDKKVDSKWQIIK